METGYIYIHNNIFPTLFAISEEEQSQGLMRQDWPPPIMSFVYSSPQVNKFWMKDTPSPLDIIFCYQGKIAQICKGEPYSTSVVGSNQLSDLVVEFPYGTSETVGIKIGYKVGIVKPTQDELKRIIAKKYQTIIKN